MEIKTESLAYWYLRLNGCLTTQSFVLHPASGSDQRTEIDVIAVRFPYRKEIPKRPLKDDPFFTTDTDCQLILLTEVKRGRCGINDPWLNTEKKNLEDLISAIGAFRLDLISTVANDLRTQGVYLGESAKLTIFCLGKKVNTDLQTQFPQVKQVTWNPVLTFIHNRFSSHHKAKAAHQQWDQDGKNLWKTYDQNKCNCDNFINAVKIEG